MTSTSASTLRTAARTTLLTVALAATVFSGTSGVVGAYNGQSTPADKTHSNPANPCDYMNPSNC